MLQPIDRKRNLHAPTSLQPHSMWGKREPTFIAIADTTRTQALFEIAG